MRQWVALILAFALLFISSVPYGVEAASCLLTDGGSQMAMQHDQAEMNMLPVSDGCRIECACGCHRNIDSLPQLLAPHATDSGVMTMPMAKEQAPGHVETMIEAFALQIPLPPPRNI